MKQYKLTVEGRNNLKLVVDQMFDKGISFSEDEAQEGVVTLKITMPHGLDTPPSFFGTEHKPNFEEVSDEKEKKKD
jgi:hypothetical protein